ncbi:hypothetical protein B382_25492 [Stutzerimonas stutzeri B1SMN1]|nr:hypothetical protein B382_25492 [Stutzerimonas stutzeri B1SMN1]
MTIYITDKLGVLSGPVELPVIPGLGVQMPSNAIDLPEPLTEPSAGHIWALVEGVPTQLANHRGTVYSTATGVAQQHDQLGELPDGLTSEPRPSAWHVWQIDGWVLDEAAQAQAEQDRAAADIAARRYKAEVAGITISGMQIDTGRDSQALITGATVQAVLDPAYSLRWKTPAGFVDMTAEQIIAVASAVRAHVQACFDRESALLDALADGAFTPEMMDEGWPA